jgi:hypothetical protein
MFSMENPKQFGLLFSWKGRNHLIEQDQPFDADEVVAKAEQWADTMDNAGLPKGWSKTL